MYYNISTIVDGIFKLTLFNEKRKMISERLQKESKLVREESMKVLAEFEKLRDKNKKF